MIKSEIKGVDLELFYEKLNNGLEVFIVPIKNAKNNYVTYSSKYGGTNNDFVPNGENKMTSFPMGIAHFLEHKMFEQEDGTNVFNYFLENGSDANANTGSKKTTYLFSGVNNLEDNILFLLDYVEKPYFTDENVEKEKGIIIQEIKMYDDKPYSRMYESVLYNSFIKHPLKYPTIGTIESVSSITKEYLYKCYNTFYNPSNMFVVVTGNVDPDNIINLIKEHEEKRIVTSAKSIKLKSFNEPNKVAKKNETIYMDITIPKTAIAYKIDVSNLKKYEMDRLYWYILNIFDLTFGPSSVFNEQLRKTNLISNSLDITGIKADNHILVIIDFESKKTSKVISLIKKQINNLNITKEELERRKKVTISDFVYASDNIFKINGKIMSDVINHGFVETDVVNKIRNTTYEDCKYILNNINLDNYTIFNIKPNSDKK